MKLIGAFLVFFWGALSLGAAASDLPMVELSLKVLSYDEKVVTVETTAHKKVTLPRDSLAKDITTNVFKVYRIQFKDWASINGNP
jgi:hypothetical protein